MARSAPWQYREADSDEERFGLLDPPGANKYKIHPILIEPEGDLPSGRPLTAFGFTSGIGSMLVGCHQLGYKVVGNIEWRDYYRYQSQPRQSTFTHNFPGAFMARGIADVPSNMMPGSIDFLAGHPECGRYSALANAVTDPRYLQDQKIDVSDIPMFLRMVAELRPRFFLMDDLPGSFAALPMSEYVRLLPDYDLFPEWVSNWGYGNIQKLRNRMFIVGALKSEGFAFRAGEEEHTVTVAETIHDLVDIVPGAIPNHAAVDLNHRPYQYAKLRQVGDRPTWADVFDYFKAHPDEMRQPIPYYSDSGERKTRPGTRAMKWDGPCYVLNGAFAGYHPVAHRPFTIRERARIQGFPDDFLFYFEPEGPFNPKYEPYTKQSRGGVSQTGKAMPVQFCTFVADQVKHHIDGIPFAATGDRVIKPNPEVSEAKKDFCALSGYADQFAACAACWLRDECDLPQKEL